MGDHIDAAQFAKSNWTLDEIGWQLVPPCSISDWDGLTRFFLKIIEAKPELLQDKALRRYYRMAKLSLPNIREL